MWLIKIPQVVVVESVAIRPVGVHDNSWSRNSIVDYYLVITVALGSKVESFNNALIYLLRNIA